MPDNAHLEVRRAFFKNFLTVQIKNFKYILAPHIRVFGTNNYVV